MLSKMMIADVRPAFLARILVMSLRRLFREAEINRLLEEHAEAEGIEFVERILEHFDFSYSVSNTDRENIPVSRRVIIVANHPLGALDALALLRLVGEERTDVRVVANDLLNNLPPMRPLLLPIDILNGNPIPIHANFTPASRRGYFSISTWIATLVTAWTA